MLLHDKLKNKKIILASRSPRRKALMEEAGISFVVADSYEVEENFPAGMPACEVPLYLAQLKSMSYPHEISDNEIVITADTVVVLDGEILGKPKDRSDAAAILSRLSGREHTVTTGVALRTHDRETIFSVETRVRFRSLLPEEINYYIDNYKPYDKAGAYGIQEWIGYVGIESVDGSFYNVMGLPVQSLYVNLAKFVDCNEPMTTGIY